MLDPRDEAYVDAEPDPGLREAMRCALTTYRQPDALGVGDRLPPLVLRRLHSGRSLRLAARRGRPLMLFFGSYT